MKKSILLQFLVAIGLIAAWTMPVASPVGRALAFDYDWEEDKPDGDLDDISTGDDQMRDDKKAIRERLAVDHNWKTTEGSDTTIGYHKALHMIDQEAATTDTQTLYNRAGDLYWHDVSGNQIQLSKDAGVNGTAVKGTVPAASLTMAAPVGMMGVWPTDTAPTGWLLCYGQAVSRETYAALYAVIGTTFGVGDGSTTFNLPDFRGRFPLGQDDMGGSGANRVTDSDADTIGGADGVESVTLTAAQSGLPAHAHTVGKVNNNDGGSGGIQQSAAANATTENTGTVSAADASEAHTNMPPFMTVNWIIKY